MLPRDGSARVAYLGESLEVGALSCSWPLWRHGWFMSPSSGLVVFRDTLGDSGSLAELSETSSGLLPCKATVSAVLADSALRLHQGKEDRYMW